MVDVMVDFIVNDGESFVVARREAHHHQNCLRVCHAPASRVRARLKKEIGGGATHGMTDRVSQSVMCLSARQSNTIQSS